MSRYESGEDPGRDWMLSLQRGDADAFNQLVLHYERDVRRFIARYLSDPSRADDLAQEAFLRVYKARARYEPTAKFRTWLLTIVTRLCLNEIRSQTRRRKIFAFLPGQRSVGQDGEREESPIEAVADTQQESPVEQLERRELEQVLREAVNELPERQRAAILLLRFEDTPYQDIATALGVSTMAVKSLINRARESLRNKLAAYRDGRWKPEASLEARPQPGGQRAAARQATNSMDDDPLLGQGVLDRFDARAQET